MAPLTVDPVAYLNFHHSVGRCRAETSIHQNLTDTFNHLRALWGQLLAQRFVRTPPAGTEGLVEAGAPLS